MKADLLIHSMAEFEPILTGALTIAGARNIVEIGAEFGGTTPIFAAHAAANGGTLTSVDPAPKQEFLDWVAANPHVRHVDAPSLEVIEDLENIDAWIIDGDHKHPLLASLEQNRLLNYLRVLDMQDEAAALRSAA